MNVYLYCNNKATAMKSELKKIKNLLEGKSIQQAKELLSEECGELMMNSKNIICYKLYNNKLINSITCYGMNQIVNKVSFSLNY